MSNVIEVLTINELLDVVQEYGDVVIDFAAEPRCAPCRAFAPHFAAASEQLESIAFVHVDVDEADPELVNAYKVMSIPTVYRLSAGVDVPIPVTSRTLIKLIKELEGVPHGS